MGRCRKERVGNWCAESSMNRKWLWGEKEARKEREGKEELGTLRRRAAAAFQPAASAASGSAAVLAPPHGR